VRGGVWETRAIFGPGYRICFSKGGTQLVLGGDKFHPDGQMWRKQ
jgi:putative component of toxin-antitoxin plasmid stabilization module